MTCGGERANRVGQTEGLGGTSVRAIGANWAASWAAASRHRATWRTADWHQESHHLVVRWLRCRPSSQQVRSRCCYYKIQIYFHVTYLRVNRYRSPKYRNQNLCLNTVSIPNTASSTVRMWIGYCLVASSTSIFHFPEILNKCN